MDTISNILTNTKNNKININYNNLYHLINVDSSLNHLI